MTGGEAAFTGDPIEDAAVDRALEEWLQPHGLHITLTEQTRGMVTARIPDLGITTTGTDAAGAIDAVMDALTQFVRDALREGTPLPIRNPAYFDDEEMRPDG